MAHGVATSTNLKFNSKIALGKLPEGPQPDWLPVPSIFQGKLLLDVGGLEGIMHPPFQIYCGWIENHQIIAWSLKMIVWKHLCKQGISFARDYMLQVLVCSTSGYVEGPIACPPCRHPPHIQAVSRGHSDDLCLGTLPTTGAGPRSPYHGTVLASKTGDGRNPSLVDILDFPLFAMFLNVSRLMQDFRRFLQHYIVSMELAVLSDFDRAWARCLWLELILFRGSLRRWCTVVYCICWSYM